MYSNSLYTNIQDTWDNIRQYFVLQLYSIKKSMYRVLLKFGADIEATDDLGRRPIECIPDASTFELVPDAQVETNRIQIF